jgi:hypothetical protein
MGGTALHVSRKWYEGRKEGKYPSTVEFNRRSILLVVGDQCACDGGYDGRGRDVSQSRAEFQCLALSGACGENMRGDFVAGENECRHYSCGYQDVEEHRLCSRMR